MTTRTEEQTLIVLRDICRRAHEASSPLDCVEATLAIEELAAQAIHDIRQRRREPSPLTAPDLLGALKQAVAALNQAPRFAVPGLDTNSYKIAAVCDKAIARATGGHQS